MRFYSIIIAMLLAIFIAGGLDKTSGAAEKEKAPAISKPSGGYTVEELFLKKEELKGKKVTVRGEVIKFNSNIMGKNWVHLKDGSGKEGTNDLTITTSQVANVGDKVVVTGVMAINKDVGAGHKFEVLLEEGSLTPSK